MGGAVRRAAPLRRLGPDGAGLHPDAPRPGLLPWTSLGKSRVRKDLQAWASRPGGAVLALYATETGEVRRLTGNDDALDGALTDILRKLSAGEDT